MSDGFSGRESEWYAQEIALRQEEVTRRNELFKADLQRNREAGLYDTQDGGFASSPFALLVFARGLVVRNGFTRRRIMEYFARNWNAPLGAQNQLATIANAPLDGSDGEDEEGDEGAEA